MSEITNITPVSTKELLEKLSYFKFNPAAIQDLVLDYLSSSDQTIDIVDCSNPFVFLLEASSVLTSSAVLENHRYLRKQYPSLATNIEELYIHLSDRDVVNRFAKPAKTTFDFLILKSDLDSKFIRDESINGYRLTIPRNTQINIAGHDFSIEYPVHILKHYHGGLQVVYDLSKPSSLLEIKNNIIPYTVYKDASLAEWVKFSLETVQVGTISAQIPINSSTYFNETIEYQNQFVDARVYYRSNSDTWIELNTTLTDQVFDINVPTAILKVLDNKLTVNIPKIYLTNEVISGIIRIDIYSSKGLISLNTASYKLDAFEVTYKALDELNDLSVYTANVSALAMIVTNSRLVSGGESELSFKELKDRLIYNSLSVNRIPITNKQVEGYLADIGFDVVLNTDLVTNRIFVATRSMILPTDKHMLSSMDAVVMSFIENLDALRGNDRVAVNSEQLCILSNSVFKNENGVLRLLTNTETRYIETLDVNVKLELLNSNKYYFTPFYYVLDASKDEFETRVYELDTPRASGLNYIAGNSSLDYIVNVGEYELLRTENGYKLIVVTVSDSGYKKLLPSNCSAVMSFKAVNEKDLSFVKAKYIGSTADKELIFEFELTTSLELLGESINFTNLTMYQDSLTELLIGLSISANIVFFTTQVTNENRVDGLIDSYMPNYQSAADWLGISLYQVDLEFGKELSTLWKQSRSLVGEAIYRKWDVDVPLVYDVDIYKKDPVTGSVFTINQDNTVTCEIVHHKGEVVLDTNNEIVFKHRVGDIMLDHLSNPVPLNNAHVFRSVDLFLFDAKYYYTTDTLSRGYLELTKATLLNWLVNDLVKVRDILLEQTKIYFKPVNSRGIIKVKDPSNKVIDILAEQELKIDYYVPKVVFDNIDLRNMIYYTTIGLVNEYLTNNLVVSTSSIIKLLQDSFSNEVTSISVKGLGANDYDLVTVVNSVDRLSVSKKLYRMSDNSLAVRENIRIEFILTE